MSVESHTNAEPGNSANHPEKESVLGFSGFLAAILLVTLSCLRFPQAALSAMMDPSWAGVLIHAREKSLQFGSDIVFTYGPLGFLSIECFSPHAPVARIFFELAIGAWIAAGLCLLAWRQNLPGRLVWLGYFIFVSLPLHWGGDALLVDFGLLAWGWLCFFETGRRLKLFLLLLAGLAAIGALIKFSFLVTGITTVAMVAFHLALQGKRALAAVFTVGFFLAFILLWLLLVQSFSGLGVFLSNSCGVASGYNQAMGLQLFSARWIFFITLLAFIAVAVRLRFVAGRKLAFLKKLPLGFWLAGMLFAKWKYGCVRTDYDHVAALVGFIPLIALSAPLIPIAARSARLASRLAAIGCVCCALILLHDLIAGFFPAKCVKHAGMNFYRNLKVLCLPSVYLRDGTEAFQAEERNAALPKIKAVVGHAGADVFGQNQGFALLNGLNYQPRPVFQSYCAYTPAMMELNEHYYLSKNAPEFALFNLQAIDNRFPPLEDALTLRNYLVNYAPLFGEADYLLLRRKGISPAQMILVTAGTVRAGQKINLPASPNTKTKLWLEIELRPTVAGRLEEFFYKPCPLQLLAWSRRNPGEAIKFNAPAAMLSAGFLASPLTLNNEDFLKLYQGEAATEPEAYSLEMSGEAIKAWEPDIHFRVYRIEPNQTSGAN